MFLTENKLHRTEKKNFMKIRKYTVLIQSLMIAMIFFLVYLAAEGLVSAIRIGVTAFLCSIVIRYTASSMRHKSSL
jgi:hypothetical protein